MVNGLNMLSFSICHAAPDGSVIGRSWDSITLVLLCVATVTILLLWRGLHKAKRKLAEKENYYNKMTDSFPLGALLMDGAGQPIFMNKTMRQWFPASDASKPPQGMGKEFSFLGSQLSLLAHRVMQDGQVHQDNVELTMEGGKRVIHVVAGPEMDSAGDIVSVLAAVEDVTSSYITGKEKEARLNCLKSVVDGIPLPLHYKGLDQRYMGCNKAYAELLGVSDEAIVGATVDDFFPEDWAERSLLMECEVFEAKAMRCCEAALRLPSGELRDVLIQKTPFRDTSNQPCGIVTLISDVTGSKRDIASLVRAERTYRGLFQNAPLGVFRCTVAGRLVEANPMLAKFFGFHDVPEMMNNLSGAKWFFLEEPRQRAGLIKRMLYCESTTRVEKVYVREDNVTLHCCLHVRLFFGDDGNPAYIDGVVEDISEKRRVEEHLRLVQAQTENASHLKSDFIAVVTHELRTPLTSVLGFSKLLRKKLETNVVSAVDKSNARAVRAVEQMRSGFEMLMSDAEVLAKLVNNVMELAKIESGQFHAWMRSEPIHLILKQAVSEAKPQYAKVGLELELRLPDDLPNVHCDRDLILDLVRHLLDNARKFTSKGTVVVAAASNNGKVEVSVSDTGKGIPQDKHEHIFKTFTQVGDALTEKPKGTGLGLAICRGIVEFHGGKLLVQSIPNKGSVFTFDLPLGQTAQP